MTVFLAGTALIVILVVLHEFGHYLAAKLFGIGVPIFSVGMGPKVFGIKIGETEYRLSALPFGGYVQMSGADPFGEEDRFSDVPESKDFMKKPVWQRLIVLFAGPAINLILPVFVFTGLFMFGMRSTDRAIGTVEQGSPAEELGFQAGDVIVAVSGRPVETFADFLRYLDDFSGEAFVVDIQRGSDPHRIEVPTSLLGRTPYQTVDLATLGLSSNWVSAKVGIDDFASPAAIAGLKTGDRILTVDGTEIANWLELNAALVVGQDHEVTYRRAVECEEVVESTTLRWNHEFSPNDPSGMTTAFGLVPSQLYIGAFASNSAISEQAGDRVAQGDRILAIDGEYIRSFWDISNAVRASGTGKAEEMTFRPLSVELIRPGQEGTYAIEVLPNRDDTIVLGETFSRPLLGVAPIEQSFVLGPPVAVQYGFSKAVSLSSFYIMRQTSAIFQGLTNLVTVRTTPDKVLGSPVEIYYQAGRAAEMGFQSFLSMLAVISLSLGFVNLLPIPALDGGQIVFYTLEWIRGRPVSIEIRERVQMLGVLALFSLFVWVFAKDLDKRVFRPEPNPVVYDCDDRS